MNIQAPENLFQEQDELEDLAFTYEDIVSNNPCATMSDLQIKAYRDAFEPWAEDHHFKVDWDKERRIYINVFTQGAFMAWCAAEIFYLQF